VEIQLARVQAYLADRKIELALSDAAEEHLAEAGYDPAFGARPLKRVIQREILNGLANEILQGNVEDGSCVVADMADGKMVFRVEAN
jgi:ATP-dependent Clp protease ATP-binding subunit ClpB